MTSIQLDDLSLVTGGRGGCQQQQQQQQPQAQDPSAGAAAPQPSGGALQGFDQFLSFFQSEGFQQLLGGIRSAIGSFGGIQQQAPAAAPTQSA